MVVEIEITSSYKNRFEVYADMGVPEIWRDDGNSFSINVLQNQKCKRLVTFGDNRVFYVANEKQLKVVMVLRAVVGKSGQLFAHSQQ